MSEGQRKGFHAHEEWFFRREPDGSVTITYPSDGGERTFVLDPDSWASVVASVSAGGETGERFQAARRFHDGDGIT